VKKDRISIQPTTTEKKLKREPTSKPGESVYLSNAFTMIVGESGEENR
jgi:hypothetical protein